MFASLLNILLKETSARGCDIVALRQRVHLETKGVGYYLPVVARYTIGTTSAISFLISLSHVIGRGVPKDTVTLNGEC